jgi:hypothetical protein
MLIKINLLRKKKTWVGSLQKWMHNYTGYFNCL